MKKNLFTFILLFFTTLVFIGCSSDDDNGGNPEIQNVSQTLIMYWPWTGNKTASDDGLTSYFRNNLSDLKQGIINSGGIEKNQKVVVLFSESPTSARLFELVKKGNTIEESPIKTYNNNLKLGNSTGLTTVLNDIKNYTYSKKYAMVYGGHGMGWVPKSVMNGTRATMSYASKDGLRKKNVTISLPKFSKTRYIGSGTDLDYVLDISEINEGISNAGIKLQYLLFDDCYMANAETAYALRGATEHLVASTCEVMAYGMPYEKMYKYMHGANPNYNEMTNEFYNFYSNYREPYGAISVIDCSKIEALASVMKNINSKYTFNEANRSNVQVLDGIDKGPGNTGMNIFYDINSYVLQLVPSGIELQSFKSALASAVVANKYTPQVYSFLFNTGYYINMNNSNSGMTISDITNFPMSKRKVTTTAWWAATH